MNYNKLSVWLILTFLFFIANPIFLAGSSSFGTLDITRLNPSQNTIQIGIGEEITFSMEVGAPQGLKAIEWYLGDVSQKYLPLDGGAIDYYEQDSWSHRFNEEGTHYVYAYAYDREDDSDFVWWEINVVNNSPNLNRISPSSYYVNIDIGDQATFSVSATDQDGNLNSFDWYLSGNLMDSNAASGSSDSDSWSFTFNSAGTFIVNTYINDSHGATDLVTWEVSVTNNKPTIYRVSPNSNNLEIESGQLLTFEADATDQDGNLKAFEWFIDSNSQDYIPANGSTDSDTWSYTFNNAGVYEISSYVYDDFDDYDFISWQVTVNNPTGDLSASVDNVAGGNSNLPGENGRLILYDQSDGSVVDSDATDSNNQSYFPDLDTTLTYFLEAYHNPTNPTTIFGEEFWGGIRDITISSNATNTESFTRNMPYFSQVNIFKADTNEEVTFGTVAPTTELLIEIKITNPSGTGSDNRNVKARLLLDRNKSANGDFDNPSSSISINQGSTETISFTYTPTETGDYFYAIGTLTEIGSNFIVTDGTAWETNPLFMVEAEQTQQTIDFSGITWNVRNYDGKPGPNEWSSSPKSVWVDENGYLHLKIRKVSSLWHSVQIESQETYGYGTYRFKVASNVENFDQNTVVGLFTYGEEPDGTRSEIDIEFSKWGDANQMSVGNYVVQPDNGSAPSENVDLFDLNLTGNYSTHQFTWSSQRIDFQSWHGHSDSPTSNTLINEWTYSGNDVPETNNEKLILNFWLNGEDQASDQMPSDGQEVELVISSVDFTPAKENEVPIALASDITGQPSELYPNGLYSVSATYTDTDGREDIKSARLMLLHPGGNNQQNIVLNWNRETNEFYPWVSGDGNNYIDHLLSVDVSQITNGYKIRWNFVVKPTWPETLSGIQFGVNAVDMSGAITDPQWDFDGSSASFQNPTGVTFLIHGLVLSGDDNFFTGSFSPTFDYWGLEYINALLEKYGGGKVFEYNRESGKFNQQYHSDWSKYSEVGETILIANWAEPSQFPVSGEVEAAADAIFAALVQFGQNSIYEPLIDLEAPSKSSSFHFISHSRGTSVASELIQRFGIYDINVNYVTYLDVHDYDEIGVPRDQKFHDPDVQIWTNINYADNFYQFSDAEPVPSGRALNQLKNGLAYYQRDISNLKRLGNSLDPLFTRHTDVRYYYLGSIAPYDWIRNQGEDWYDNEDMSNAYEFGFSLWRRKGGHAYNDEFDGFSSFNEKTDPMTLDGLQNFVENPNTYFDSNQISPLNFNKNFDLPDLDPNQPAGWSYHGGEWNAELGEHFMILGNGHSSATYNRFYLPANVEFIKFKMHINKGGNAGIFDEKLRISLKNETGNFQTIFETGWENETTDFFTNATQNISNFGNLVSQLKFEIINGSGDVESEIWIDDIELIFNDDTGSEFIAYDRGWNITGIPINTQSFAYNNLFTNATQEPFSYSGTYNLSSQMKPGFGYWIHLSAGETVEYGGTLLESITLDLNKDWNLVSGIGSSVPVIGIIDPGNILSSNWYGFDGSYYSANTLDPGLGYWIKASKAGSITIDKQTAKEAYQSPIASYQPADDFNRLHFIASESDTLQTLYFEGNLPSQTEPNMYEMPPISPEGTFDARFSGISTRLAEEKSVAVDLQIPEMMDLRMQIDPTFRNQTSRWKIVQQSEGITYGEDVITENEYVELYSINVDRVIIESLEASTNSDPFENEKPGSYALEQNYPNPFNPTTQIAFELPQQEFVELAVYDMLGREVELLVSDIKNAGRHTVTFDASNLTSGVYIYRLSAGSFSEVRRLVLMK